MTGACRLLEPFDEFDEFEPAEFEPAEFDEFEPLDELAPLDEFDELAPLGEVEPEPELADPAPVLAPVLEAEPLECVDALLVDRAARRPPRPPRAGWRRRRWRSWCSACAGRVPAPRRPARHAAPPRGRVVLRYGRPSCP